MATNNFELDWSDLAFGSKAPLNDLRAVFVVAPRDISQKRIISLIKEWLPKSNLVLGIAKEPHVTGFENQAQFKTLQLNKALQALIAKVNTASPKHKITVLHYMQRDAVYVIEKCHFTRVLLVNGSWQYSFHYRPEYYALVNSRIPYELISPFVDEAEAKSYAVHVIEPLQIDESPCSEITMMRLAELAATRSFDYTFQTGCALAKQVPNKMYRPLLVAHNTVVPYETYAMHHGSSRERHYVPMNDANYYDTVHAEMTLLTKVLRQGIALEGTTLFVNLLPCPACARVLSMTEVREIVYARDHSNGYAATLLAEAGKTVRRVVIAESEE